MNKSTPKVSVVMSVYNGSHYLQRSIESILNQTFTDFEFIIIDDGSTDNTWDLITEYANRDRRIKCFKNQENLGLTQTLNKGLNLARGEYLARQDVDDVSFPERLEKQVSYLELHPSVALISTGVQYVDNLGNQLWLDIPPTDPTVMRWEFLFRNPLRHPTVMWRRELVDSEVGNYDPSFFYTQDYDFWVRISENLNIEAISSVLVQMCWHDQSISSTKAKTQDSLGTRVIMRQIEQYFPHESLQEADIANLRIMPRRRDNLQQQYFLNMSASDFRQAAKRYLSLWYRFKAINNLKQHPLSCHLIEQEVEQNLGELLLHCKQKRWFFIAGEIFLDYVLHSPHRTRAFIYTVLKTPWMIDPYRWHYLLKLLKPSPISQTIVVKRKG